MLTNILLTVLL